MNDRPTTRMAAARMVAAGLLLGTLGAFAAEARLDSLSIAFYRCVLGGAALAAYCRWAGIRIAVPATARLLALAIASGVLMAGNWWFFFEALARCGIAVATLAFHIQPILVVLVGAWAFGERIAARDIGWVVLAFAGLGATLAEKAAEPMFDAAYWFGIGAALVAAACYTGVTLIARALGAVPPALLALIQCAVGAVLLAGLGPQMPGTLAAYQWLWLAGLGAIHTALVYALIYGALPQLSTGSIAALLFVYPAAAVVVDWTVYARPLSLLQLAGLALILAGAWGALARGGRAS